ncbi:MAG: hypothetical protein U0359_14855 [Byssovorax sp.]
MNRSLRVALAGLLLLTPSVLGCSSKYLKAVDVYAKANGESVKALSSVPAAVSMLCRKDAEAAFLMEHLPPGPGLPSSTVRWSKWLDEAKATEKLTWRAYCKEIDDAGAGVTAAIAALSAYADALSSLAGEGTYDGADIKGLISSGGDLGNLGGETLPGKVVKGMAEPLGALGARLFNAVTERKIKEFSTEADREIQPILKGLIAYVSAAEQLLDEVEMARTKAVDRVEALGEIYRQPVTDLARVGQVYALAASLSADTREARAMFKGYKDMLGSLKKAQDRLTLASPDDAGARDVISAIADIASNLSKLKAALTAKEE